MLKLKVNNIEIEVEEGMTVLLVNITLEIPIKRLWEKSKKPLNY